MRSGTGDTFSDVWSVAALDDLLSSAVRTPVVRLVADGRPIPSARYTRRVRLGGADLADVIDPAAVAAEFAQGATVVGQSLHRTRTDVGRFVSALAREVSHPIQANSYLTPAGAVGLAPHSDAHDVVVVQLDGSKRWDVDGPGEVVLSPGDVVYVPAGTRHRAESMDRPSLHLTVGILTVTRRAVVERALRDLEELDRPLPLRFGGDGGSVTDDVSGAIEAVVDHLRSLDVDEVASAERGRRLVRPPAPGALLGVLGAADIGERSIVTRHRSWSWRTERGRIVVTCGRRRVEVPLACGDAIDALGGDRDVAVGDLPGLDAGSRVVLARRLVVEGLLVVVDLAPPGACAERSRSGAM
ncbi:JmjC domain-containing protein [Ilumatobacter sp.]|uniref:JmjC domain-containing protein n=1 Tax=Ilumatobacter sp. TaxID=1967498 RepID=UPI003B52AF32